MKTEKSILKVLASIIVLILVLLFAVFKINIFLPVYKITNQDGKSVFIDGVRYKSLPNIEWIAAPGNEAIGYADNWFTVITGALNDSNRNFIYLHYFGASTVYGPLYRTDIQIPEPSVEVIDELTWCEQTIGGNDEYLNISEDKEIIRELFYVLNTYEKIEYKDIRKYSEEKYISISCTSSNITGAHYNLYLGLYKDEIVCGNPDNKYVVIPIDLLEKIAGKKLDFIDEAS